MAPHRPFPVFSRILHWTMAVLVLAMLFIGIGMVASLSNYHWLLSIHRPLGILVIALAATSLTIAGCSSKSSTSNTAAPVATTEAQAERNALPATQAVPVPRGFHCSDADIVWVNLARKTWHEPDDPYYGRTKHGEYMCRADANAKGYHAAGTMRHHRMKSGGEMNPKNAETPQPYNT